MDSISRYWLGSNNPIGADDEYLYKQIRQKIPDVIAEDSDFDNDSYLRLWLKIGKYNSDRTVTIIREAIKWRREKNAKVAQELDFDPEIAKAFRMHMDGHTRNGFLVVSGNGGVYKFKSRIARFGREDVLYHWLQVISRAEKMVIDCAQRAAKQGVDVKSLPLIQKSWLILNMKNLEYEDVLCRDAISLVNQLVKMAVWYFPGLEGTLCVINADRLVEIILKTVKPLLKGSNIDLLVFDSDEVKYKAVIHKYVDPNQIRVPFGGNLDYIEEHSRDRA